MTVLNVLSTNAIAADATEYQVVQTGYYRVVATAGDATVAFNGGPAITLIQDQALLLKGGKPGQARIVKGVDDYRRCKSLVDEILKILNSKKLTLKR